MAILTREYSLAVAGLSEGGARGKRTVERKSMTLRWIIVAASGNRLIIWGSFGVANKLIVPIALMTGAAYVAKKLKSSFVNAVVVPAWILWLTVTAALV